MCHACLFDDTWKEEANRELMNTIRQVHTLASAYLNGERLSDPVLEIERLTTYILEEYDDV